MHLPHLAFKSALLKPLGRDFPCGPVAKTPRSQCRGPGLIPGQGTRSHLPQLRVPMPQLRVPMLQLKDLTCGIKDPKSGNEDPAADK